MIFSDLHEHVFKRPDRNIAGVAAPIAGGSFGRFGHLGVVGAAQRLSALGVGADLVAEVEMNVGQMKNLAHWRTILLKEIFFEIYSFVFKATSTCSLLRSLVLELLQCP